jgi:antirestriction protein ArdC
MLCGVAGIAPQTVANSASYLQSWLRALKADSRMIVGAASSAQKAADYILGRVA